MLLITSSGSRQVAIYLSAHLPKVLDPCTHKWHYSTGELLRPLTTAVAQHSGVKLTFLLQNTGLLN